MNKKKLTIIYIIVALIYVGIFLLATPDVMDKIGYWIRFFVDKFKG